MSNLGRLKPKTNTRLYVFLFIVAMAVAAGWAYMSPQWAVGEIRTAIQQGDISTLRKQIDFPALRSNIKVRMAKEMTKATRVDGTPFGVGMELIGGVMLDTVIGKLVTPEWLIGAGMAADTASAHESVKETLDAKAKTRFVSVSEAHVVLSNDSGDVILIFERRGIDWVLVDVDGVMRQ